MMMLKGVKSLCANTLSGVLVLASALNFGACQTDEAETHKYVDLRFSAESSYQLSAASPAEIVFEVRSTDPWEVFNTNSEWCSIEPSEGVAEDRVTVTVKYTENTELDDRVDVITIKSDHWVGHEAVVVQKGIAYLTTENLTDAILSELGDYGSFDIKSNQDWSLEIDSECEDWLSITENKEGNGDATVTYEVDANVGAIRTGTIIVKNRLDEVVEQLEVTQAGIVVKPETTEIRVAYDELTFTLPVESNTEWVVTKDNEYATWYTLNTVEGENDGEIQITLSGNKGTSILASSFTISSKPVEGVEPVEQIVAIKQSYNPVTEVIEFDATELSKCPTWNGSAPVLIGSDDAMFTVPSRVYKTSIGLARYEFAVKSIDAGATAGLYLGYNGWGTEVRTFVYGTTFECSAHGMDQQYFSVDTSGEFTFGVEVSKGDNGYANIAWFFNGVKMHELINTDAAVNVKNDSVAEMIFGAQGDSGNIVYDYRMVTEVFDWNE